MFYVLLDEGKLIIKYMTFCEMVASDITKIRYRSTSGVHAQIWVDKHPLSKVFDPSRMPVKIEYFAVLAWDA